MDIIEAKAQLALRVGHLPEVYGVGILKGDRLGVYLYEGVETLEIPEFAFPVEIIAYKPPQPQATSADST
jgi:hypothetical protein